MEVQSIPLDKLGIPPEFARYVQEGSPREIKLLAARGLIPAPPKVLIAIQYCLLGEADEVLNKAGRDGLMAHPPKVLDGALDEQTHPKILEFFAFNRTNEEAVAEKLLLLRQLNDRSICYLAEQVAVRQLEIIAGNQERLLISPILFQHIRKNPAASQALLDRVESFLRMYKLLEVEEDGSLELSAEAAEGPSADEPLEFEHGYEVEEEEDFPEEMLDEGELSKDFEEKKGDIWATLGSMPISKKIKLAYFGNSQVRSILVRDRNKIVATSVMKSPRMTDSEVVSIAKSRNVCDEVLREIVRNKEWFKKYSVKLALVNNPKTPTAVSIRLVSSLMGHDLKMLANNRNIPSAVTMTAKQQLKKKKV